MKIYGAYLACLVAAIFVNIGFASQLKGELATAQRLQLQTLERNKVFDGEIASMLAQMKTLSVQSEQACIEMGVVSERIELVLTPDQRMFETLNARVNAIEDGLLRLHERNDR